MAFDWSDFLDFAEGISQKTDPSEAEIRSAISRAYYSIHNLAANSAPLLDGKKRAHADLIGYYRNDRANVTYQEAGKILSGLRFDRTKADYDADTTKLGNNLIKKLQSVISQTNDVKQRLGL